MTESTIGLLLGDCPSAPYLDLLRHARERDCLVFVPTAVLEATPEIALLADSMSIRLHAVGDDLTTVTRNHDLTALITFDERYAYQALEATVHLRRPDLPTPADKLDMRRLLNSRGMSHTKVWPLDGDSDLAAALAECSPIVVKPRRGVSSRDIAVVGDMAAWYSFAARHDIDLAHGKYFAEQFHDHIPFGDDADWYAAYVSVDVFMSPTGPEFLPADRAAPTANFGETGLLIPSRMSDEHRACLQDWAARIGGIWDGHWPAFHIEFVHTADGFQVVEVNPRLGGYLHVMSTASTPGADLVGAVFDICAGLPPHLPAPDTHAAYILVHPPGGAGKLVTPPDYRHLTRISPNIGVARRRKRDEGFDARHGTLNAICDLLVTAPDRRSLLSGIDAARQHILSTARFTQE
ncbi:acetyl-CoA carboxylase biotin carboxylase subunit family protein [Nocardia sp. NPDC058497]|uniref:ATP-grasp domain-containing protein n=1 Tax=Nocardia sp. NPDC058497 TaxID=3346529 RepID=UPI0036545F42